jgi:hypothetical protein
MSVSLSVLAHPTSSSAAKGSAALRDGVCCLLEETHQMQHALLNNVYAAAQGFHRSLCMLSFEQQKIIPAHLRAIIAV